MNICYRKTEQAARAYLRQIGFTKFIVKYMPYGEWKILYR